MSPPKKLQGSDKSLNIQQMQEWFDQEGLMLGLHENDQHEMANVL